MRLCLLAATTLTCILSACNENPESSTQTPIEIHDVKIYAPLPGTSMSVAYMTLTNNTTQAISIGTVSSPDFRRVEMHESTLTDGVARMRKLDELVIPPQSSLLLEERGKHLMLMEPVDTLALEQPISLRVHHGPTGEIVIRSLLQSRIQLDTAEDTSQ